MPINNRSSITLCLVRAHPALPPSLNPIVIALYSFIRSEANACEPRMIPFRKIIQIYIPLDDFSLSPFTNSGVTLSIQYPPTDYSIPPPAVKNIKRQHLVELKALANPPLLVKLTLECVCSMLGENVTGWGDIRRVSDESCDIIHVI